MVSLSLINVSIVPCKSRISVYLRWRQSVEGQQEHDQPKNRVDDLGRELHRGKEQRKQADMTCHRERPEGTQVSPILQCE